jgi:hypothetical protein
MKINKLYLENLNSCFILEEIILELLIFQVLELINNIKIWL